MEVNFFYNVPKNKNQVIEFCGESEDEMVHDSDEEDEYQTFSEKVNESSDDDEDDVDHEQLSGRHFYFLKVYLS